MGDGENRLLNRLEDKDSIEMTSEMRQQGKESMAYLISARNEIASLEKMKKSLDALKVEERRLQKSIGSEEKSIEDEIRQTVQRKRDEIESNFDGHLKENKEKEKRLLVRRAKKKNEKVNERVKEETADLRLENKKLATEMDTLFKQNRVPRLCNSKLYYSLFMTKGIVEFLEFLAAIFICIVVIPGLFCIAAEETFLAGMKNLKLYYIIIFLGTIVLFFFVYILILNSTKVKYHSVLVEGRKIKDKVKANEKTIKAITNSVRKDKDESHYNLQKYDKKLEEIREEAKSILDKRQVELTKFEEVEKETITESIRNRRRDGLELIKKKYEENNEKIELCEKAIAEKQKVIEDYKKRIGESYMEYDVLQDLITIIEEEDAVTIEDAIQFYNN